MLLNKMIRLDGTRQERAIKALEMAGWYIGRSVDISEVEAYYEKCGVALNEGARQFFREYYGLAEHWWVDRDSKPNQAADFEFSLMPNGDYLQPKDLMFDDADYKVPSEDYVSVEQIAGEAFVFVGSIGYYYSARVWIGESGRVYSTHEYDMDAHAYDSVVDLIVWELQKQPFDYITIQKELDIAEKQWLPPVYLSDKYRFKG